MAISSVPHPLIRYEQEGDSRERIMARIRWLRQNVGKEMSKYLVADLVALVLSYESVYYMVSPPAYCLGSPCGREGRMEASPSDHVVVSELGEGTHLARLTFQRGAEGGAFLLEWPQSGLPAIDICPGVSEWPVMSTYAPASSTYFVVFPRHVVAYTFEEGVRQVVMREEGGLCYVAALGKRSIVVVGSDGLSVITDFATDHVLVAPEGAHWSAATIDQGGTSLYVTGRRGRDWCYWRFALPSLRQTAHHVLHEGGASAGAIYGLSATSTLLAIGYGLHNEFENLVTRIVVLEMGEEEHLLASFSLEDLSMVLWTHFLFTGDSFIFRREDPSPHRHPSRYCFHLGAMQLPQTLFEGEGASLSK